MLSLSLAVLLAPPALAGPPRSLAQVRVGSDGETRAAAEGCPAATQPAVLDAASG